VLRSHRTTSGKGRFSTEGRSSVRTRERRRRRAARRFVLTRFSTEIAVCRFALESCAYARDSRSARLFYVLKSVLDLDERELVTSPRASPKEARPTSPRVRSLDDARVQRLSVPGSTPTRLNPPRDRREETKSDTLDCSDCSFDDKMSLATATARVAPATPARCSRRACSCECAVHTRSAACSRRAARSGASLAPTRGSVRRGKPLTRMSATPGKNAPVATEDAPEMDRAVFAAATGLFSPVGTSPRDRSRAHPDSSPPEARPRTPPPRVSLPRTNTSPDVSAATFRRLI